MHRALTTMVVTIALLLVPATPAVVNATQTAAMPSDFNGDGYADLAIGTPQANTRRGTVSIVYGGPTGLTAAGDQLWSQSSPGVQGSPAVADRFGWSLASGDFDRDGHADLAIGVPGEESNGVQVGAVAVLYGSRHGLSADGDQLWTTGNLPGGHDLRTLGRSVAAGDVNGDGYWDIVAGGPYSQGLEGAGVVLFGGPDGIHAEGMVQLDRSMTDAPDERLVDHEFGLAVAVGDLDDDGFADIAVGIDGEDNPGEVAVFPGSASGVDTGAGELWGRTTPGINTGAGFGRALAIADFDGDGYGDLAAGAAGEPVAGPGSGYGAGAVNVIYGSAGGLSTDRDQVWRQSSAGIPGSDEAYDSFGYALAAADIDGDGFADLAVGVPGEDWKGDFGFGKGAVVVLYGSGGGLSAEGVQRWTQDTPGIPNRREDGDEFGRSLAISDYGRRGTFDLAIGVPYEGHSGVDQAGLVTVLYSSSSGLSVKDAQVWSKATDGIKGAVDKEFFGATLGS
jgi:hypothetical protein